MTLNVLGLSREMRLAPIRIADDHIGTGLASVKGVFVRAPHGEPCHNLPRAVMVEWRKLWINTVAA